ncbi:MAG: hypothetical protein ACYC9Q_09080 [Bacillota bacterium]
MRKDALPVHLDLADDGTLSLTAREPFYWLRRLAAVEAIEPGSVNTDRYLLANLTRFGKDTLTVTAIPERIEVAADDLSLGARNAASSDLPDSPEMPSEMVAAKASEFGKALKKVLYAADHDKDSVRPALQCVYFDSRDGKLALVATDGVRLAVAPTSIPWETPVLVWADTLTMFRPDDETITLGITKSPSGEPQALHIGNGREALWIHLVQAEFVNYRRILDDPIEAPAKVTLSADECLLKLRRILLSPPPTRQSIGHLRGRAHRGDPSCFVTVSEADASGVTFSVERRDEYAAQVRVPAAVSGSARVCVNGRYLLDLLRVHKGEELTLSLRKPYAPILAETPEATHLLLPLRTYEDDRLAA